MKILDFRVVIDDNITNNIKNNIGNKIYYNVFESLKLNSDMQTQYRIFSNTGQKLKLKEQNINVIKRYIENTIHSKNNIRYYQHALKVFKNEPLQ